jgi:hypothetical protein
MGRAVQKLKPGTEENLSLPVPKRNFTVDTKTPSKLHITRTYL